MRLFCVLFLASVAQCQFFDPVLDDKTYLDRIDQQLVTEVENSAAQLLQQAKVTEKATNSYISIKLKDNVFKALRTLAVARFTEYEDTVAKSRRAGRQESGGGSSSGDSDAADSEQAEGGDDDGPTEKATTPLTGLGTAVKINQNVFQFIGEAIKTIFKGVGGKRSFGREGIASSSVSSPSSDSSSLTAALPNLMTKPYSEQLIGILDILAVENSGNPLKIDPKRNPFNALFGNRRGRDEQTVVAEYIENLRQSHPHLFPDLTRGVSEPQRLLAAMSKVVSGIHEDI